MESSTPPKDHLTTFENQWALIKSRTDQARPNDASKLAYSLQSFFNSSEIKATVLLASLPSTMNEYINNLMTKDNLTYEMVYNHLITY